MPVVTIEPTETFSTLIDFQKKCYGKYTTKDVFVAGLYILSITPNFSRASYSRCSFFFLIDSSQLQKDMFGRNLPTPYNFIINTKRQNSIKCQ
jgi:hypothetical protein